MEAAYSELMRKVLIKLAICSIAFINGKIALFLLLILPLLSSPASMGVTEALTVSTVPSLHQHVHSRPALLFPEIFLARTAECLQCLLMKISFWRSMSVLNATMSSILPWGYRSSNAAKTYSSFSSI